MFGKGSKSEQQLIGESVIVNMENDVGVAGHLLHIDDTGALLVRTATRKLEFISEAEKNEIGSSTVFVPINQIVLISKG